MATTRREFLCRSLGAFGAAMLAFERFGLLNALAQSADYKALVCIFLNGGNDSGNMIIPYDDYSTYAAARGVEWTGDTAVEPVANRRRPPYWRRIRISSELDRPARSLGPRQACSGLQCRDPGGADLPR